MTFDVLQSVYWKDSAEYLDQSLESLAVQTVKPAKIVLVKDGILTPELEEVIGRWKKELLLDAVGYAENRGLFHALNYGLQFCTSELVARMDSDDICVAGRFEKQLAFMESHPEVAVSSGYIAEFETDADAVKAVRRVPLKNEEIRKYLKRRSAFNHMAVMYRKSAVVGVGGYERVPHLEDYDLWIRLMQAGYEGANIPEILVKARIGNDMIGRRQGMGYAKDELYFLKRQLKSGFINGFEYICLVIVRVPVRLLPKRMLEIIYRFLRN